MSTRLQRRANPPRTGALRPHRAECKVQRTEVQSVRAESGAIPGFPAAPLTVRAASTETFTLFRFLPRCCKITLQVRKMSRLRTVTRSVRGSVVLRLTQDGNSGFGLLRPERVLHATDEHSVVARLHVLNPQTVVRQDTRPNIHTHARTSTSHENTRTLVFRKALLPKSKLKDESTPVRYAPAGYGN